MQKNSQNKMKYTNKSSQEVLWQYGKHQYLPSWFAEVQQVLGDWLYEKLGDVSDAHDRHVWNWCWSCKEMNMFCNQTLKRSILTYCFWPQQTWRFSGRWFVCVGRQQSSSNLCDCPSRWRLRSTGSRSDPLILSRPARCAVDLWCFTKIPIFFFMKLNTVLAY